MKYFKRMANWLPANRFQAAGSASIEDSEAPSDYLGYVKAASGEDRDTRLDRTVEIYRHFRDTADPAGWHRDEALRAFIQETQYLNPYIPEVVREREVQSRSRPTSPRAFLPQWREAGYKARELCIDVDAFEAAMQSAPEIIEAFKQSNLHDTSYFFTKLTEWYITLLAQRETRARTLVDIGAAYHGFARMATQVDPNVTVSMVDLVFPSGRSNFDRRIEQIGADAGQLDMFEDDSVDLVCAHNAFEHFSGRSDSNCAKEIARVLRPGGKALISPLFCDETYSLSINPFSCFVTSSGHELSDQIEEELSLSRVRVDFRSNIVSPYSRRYDLEALKARVLDHCPQLDPCIIVPKFSDEGFEGGVYHRAVLGLDLPTSIFDVRVFQCLELTKRPDVELDSPRLPGS